MAEESAQIRRIERIEEHLTQVAADMAVLSEKNESLKSDAEKTRVDLRERIDDLKINLKEDIDTVRNSVDVLNESLQNLYITQSDSKGKINMNEKIIWAIVGILSTGALYLVQDLIKGAGAG